MNHRLFFTTLCCAWLIVGCTSNAAPPALAITQPPTVYHMPLAVVVEASTNTLIPSTATWTPTFAASDTPAPATSAPDITPMITYWRGLWTVTPPGMAFTLPQNRPFATVPILTMPPPTWTPAALPTLTLPASPIPPTALVLGDIPAMEMRLRTTPLMSNINTESVRAAYIRGQALGNRANVFTVIGDSNSVNGDFLTPLAAQYASTCTYGSYSYLLDSVAWFSAPLTPEGANSFTHDSVTAERGFNASAAFDPIWASSPVCLPNESPVACEFRSTRPVAVVIMLGGIDINESDTYRYAQAMQRIVETALSQGVIPILTTFVVLPNREVYPRSLEFNVMLVDIANLYQIPLINLWSAAQALPNYGIGPDRTHLKAQPGTFCDFAGGELLYGGTLRNLLTLQMLDALRREVISAPATAS